MPTKWSYLLASALVVSCRAPAADPGRRILANDNRTPAGRLSAATLRLNLDIRQGDWYPESDTGLSEPVLAFAEPGKPLQVPGPLIRVPVGTTIHAALHNRSSISLVVHGLSESFPLAPDSSATVEFTAGVPGTYYYWAGLPGVTVDLRKGRTTQLAGAFIVDSVGSRTDDRVFVLGEWNQPIDSVGPKPWVPRDLMTINGKMWPYTERFSYTEGDSVHWRWVNPSAANHPMHLHGFFYSVLSHGDGVSDTTYRPAERRQVVTETLVPGATMTMAWQAARAGNWLFHCHFAFHVSHFLSLTKIPDPDDPGGPTAMSHSPHMMAGLVLGLDVKRRPGAGDPSADSSTVRHLRLIARETHKSPTQEEDYHYFVQGDGVLPGDSANSTIVLRRGEPVRITIVNQLRAATAVHWHGIELTDSYMDGVPGWSGGGTHLAPSIAPGDSFTVGFTPPRAGTYMYHTHANEVHQIAHGLYGALLVVDTPPDSAHERLFVVGGFEDVALVNRRVHPAVTRMRVGQSYRLRLINIHADRAMIFSLGTDSAIAQWRPVAKDGAELPAAQTATRAAEVFMGPGEIADFEFTPTRAGQLRLEGRAKVDNWKVTAPIAVR